MHHMLCFLHWNACLRVEQRCVDWCLGKPVSRGVFHKWWALWQSFHIYVWYTAETKFRAALHNYTEPLWNAATNKYRRPGPQEWYGRPLFCWSEVWHAISHQQVNRDTPSNRDTFFQPIRQDWRGACKEYRDAERRYRKKESACYLKSVSMF